MVGVCIENGKYQACKNSQFVETTWYKRKRGRPPKKPGEELLKGKKRTFVFRPPKCQKKEINGENLLKARFYSRRGGNRRSYTL